MEASCAWRRSRCATAETALGAYYRHIAYRKGGDVAVFATARKLATLIYRLVRWGQPYVDEGAAAYEKRYQEARIKSLTAAAKTSATSLRRTLAKRESHAVGRGKSQSSRATGRGRIEQVCDLAHASGGILEENTAAAKALSSLVRYAPRAAWLQEGD